MIKLEEEARVAAGKKLGGAERSKYIPRLITIYNPWPLHLNFSNVFLLIDKLQKVDFSWVEGLKGGLGRNSTFSRKFSCKNLAKAWFTVFYSPTYTVIHGLQSGFPLLRFRWNILQVSLSIEERRVEVGSGKERDGS